MNNTINKGGEWWNQRYSEIGMLAGRNYPNEELLRFIGSTFGNVKFSERKNIKVLEIGCGTGPNLWMISKEGFSTYGLDFSKNGLELCAKTLEKWGETAKLTHGNMTKLPYNNNTFDVVFDIVSMQHLTYTDHIKAYSEIFRVLKPNGIFFSKHFGNDSYTYKYGKGKLIDKFTIDNANNILAPLSNVGISCFPTDSAIEDLLYKSKFRKVNIEDLYITYYDRNIKMQFLIITATK